MKVLFLSTSPVRSAAVLGSMKGDGWEVSAVRTASIPSSCGMEVYRLETLIVTSSSSSCSCSAG